jgi:hypothetical protein
MKSRLNIVVAVAVLSLLASAAIVIAQNSEGDSAPVPEGLFRAFGIDKQAATYSNAASINGKKSLYRAVEGEHTCLFDRIGAGGCYIPEQIDGGYAYALSTCNDDAEPIRLIGIAPPQTKSVALVAADGSRTDIPLTRDVFARELARPASSAGLPRQLEILLTNGETLSRKAVIVSDISELTC